MIFGMNGLIGSGKNIAAEYLQTKYNFQPLSFAESLKQAVSAVFGWPFDMLEGITPESREWRETIDQWWANRLNMPNLTPRWVLQQWGTEIGRQCFHADLWLASLERKLESTDNNIVISDCRFKNEMKSIRKYGGILVRINRGELPEWYNVAITQLKLQEVYGKDFEFSDAMAEKYPNIHISEWGWVNEKFDYEIDNNGSLDDLYIKIDDLVKNIS